jgi:hypothetical protein
VGDVAGTAGAIPAAEEDFATVCRVVAPTAGACGAWAGAWAAAGAAPLIGNDPVPQRHEHPHVPSAFRVPIPAAMAPGWPTAGAAGLAAGATPAKECQNQFTLLVLCWSLPAACVALAELFAPFPVPAATLALGATPATLALAFPFPAFPVPAATLAGGLTPAAAAAFAVTVTS